MSVNRERVILPKDVSEQDKHLCYVFVASVQVLVSVLNGNSLTVALTEGVKKGTSLHTVDSAAVQSICYGVLREWGALSFIARHLSRHPLTDNGLLSLFAAAFFRLRTRPGSVYATVDQAVEAARFLKLPTKLVNALLRSYLRQKDKIEGLIQTSELPEVRWNFPAWWVKKLQSDYPAQWEAIIQMSNAPPPMTIRVNQRRIDTADYLVCLTKAGIDAIKLNHSAIVLSTPIPVERLPGFSEGWVSVQDDSAQQAVNYLGVQNNQYVLDVCSAPGGKTAYILESADVEMTAVDIDAYRMEKVHTNLTRLKLLDSEKVTLCVGDGAQPQSWWDGRLYDRILLDAPCTGSGVVRRHPDSKWLRRPSDIQTLSAQQARLLYAVWPMLKPGGRLLYATCSIFPEENREQIARFLAETPNARQIPLEGIMTVQRLPTVHYDGFFYALLERHPVE